MLTITTLFHKDCHMRMDGSFMTLLQTEQAVGQCVIRLYYSKCGEWTLLFARLLIYCIHVATDVTEHYHRCVLMAGNFTYVNIISYIQLSLQYRPAGRQHHYRFLKENLQLRNSPPSLPSNPFPPSPPSLCPSPPHFSGGPGYDSGIFLELEMLLGKF